ncbi:MAG: hypothetical protein BWY69_00024 [Planctomycetes bacterium ADurb.Bin401]|nr:MAG: hypothetical protein BWY69_00024 [Planctomycetes bacterium ADurb.Bin401]
MIVDTVLVIVDTVLVIVDTVLVIVHTVLVIVRAGDPSFYDGYRGAKSTKSIKCTKTYKQGEPTKFLVKPVRFVRSFFSSKLNTVLVIVRENKDQKRYTGMAISGQPGSYLKNY